MKKYLLTGLLTFVCLFGAFTSATNYTFTSEEVGGDYLDYNPSSFTPSSSFTVSRDSIVDFDCVITQGSDTCTLVLGGKTLYYVVGDDYREISSNFNLEGGNTYNASFDEGHCFKSITITDGQNSGGGNSGGGSIGDINVSGGILSGGLTTLGSVLTSLSTAINEFIPYMVYLGLGILIVTLGFIAIKWLVNYTSRKVTGIFSSRRRK